MIVLVTEWFVQVETCRVCGTTTQIITDVFIDWYTKLCIVCKKLLIY